MKPTNPVYTGLPTTIFEVMSRLAIEHKSINLGQGFPDVDGPEDVRRFAADALMAGPNQYPPMMGVPELRQAVADANRRFYGLDVNWKSEVLVTSGATEALSDIITAVIEPGDEVVLIEPLYDCYLPLVKRAGGIPRLVRITPPEWRLDVEALEAAFSPRTKAILINNPMNPAAKVFSREELEAIAALCVRFDAYAICDEVYEHILFDGRAHIPLMTLPGMRERAIRIGSAGKTFSLTGWKVGYVTAAPALLDPIAKAHQFTTFTTPPNLQKAVAFGLGMSILLFRRFFQNVPAELFDAAFVDGCGYLGYFWHITLPLSRPILATVGIIAFVASWNSYLLPLILLNTEGKYPWPLGIMVYQGEYSKDWQLILAFITLTILPTIIVFFAAQKHIVAGLTAGAVKG